MYIMNDEVSLPKLFAVNYNHYDFANIIIIIIIIINVVVVVIIIIIIIIIK